VKVDGGLRYSRGEIRALFSLLSLLWCNGAQGLVGVGLRAALVQCGELRSCGLPMVGPQWVLLAPHLLAYYLNPDDTPAVLTRRDLVPDNTGACSMQWRDMQSIRAGRPAG
jgi:hypothetical protein